MEIGSPPSRCRLTVQGLVQGVGFRPFVYRLATALQLTGGVQNTAQGVVIEIEGFPQTLAAFRQRLTQEVPPHAHIQSIEQQRLPAKGSDRFEIWALDINKEGQGARILPDLATCPDCLQDILNPRDRRYHYPFTNCTNCGPRYSMVTALPYDRCHTTMRSFSMCPDCEAEYTNPIERRFHAQPNACDCCGPALSFWTGAVDSDHDSLGSDWPAAQPHPPLQQAIVALQRGDIVAVKGLGGFQLLVDAQNSAAVDRLRQRKDRPDKPLALMYPTLAAIHQDCEVSDAAQVLLTSAQAPIVLLPKRAGRTVLAAAIAPRNPNLGVMLPTTPLHHLLLRQFGQPVVATSGNLSGEPICTDDQVARRRLGAIAGVFLTHNRPIQRPVDDSVVQLMDSQPQVLRHARGYAPQRIQAPSPSPVSPNTHILAVGTHLKNAIALSAGTEIMLSQHIGNLETAQTRTQLKQTADDFLSLHRVQPSAIACDLHPDYGSTQLAHTLAQRWNVPLIPVQHHYAHILSGMAEHQLSSPVLGIAWDGTGYGLDQTLWGGEFLQVSRRGFERLAHFLPYALPGGEICSLEPRRSALGLLYSCYGAVAFEMSDLAPMQAFTKPQLIILQKMLSQKINAPVTSSVGRMFDGIAAILNLHQYVSFEGQAAMTLEFAARQSPVQRLYPFTLLDAQSGLIDWREIVHAIVEDCRKAVRVPVIAAKFHNTLVEIMVQIARRAGASQVVLAGGCFQNKVLTERAIQRLRSEGFTPYWPQRIPPNDGGIAVGQVMAAWRQFPLVSADACSPAACSQA